MGFKKLNDVASVTASSVASLVELNQLFLSFGIGFVAGSLAATQIISNVSAISFAQILEIAAAGYAGADFLEGFISREQVGGGKAGAAPTGTGSAANELSAADADGYAG